MSIEEMKKTLAGPADLEKLWKLLEKSGSETMEIKLFRNEGDKKPYRLMILVQGEEPAAELLKYLAERGS